MGNQVLVLRHFKSLYVPETDELSQSVDEKRKKIIQMF